MYGKSNMETCITVCKIDSQWEFTVCLRKLKQGLCINLERWDGEGDGTEVQKGGDICVPFSNNTRGDSTHGHHQMVNTEIRLIIFLAAEDGDVLYTQPKQDWELTVTQIMNYV